MWPTWCGRHGRWQMRIFRVADMVFGCGQYCLAVANIIVVDTVADMVAPQKWGEWNQRRASQPFLSIWILDAENRFKFYFQISGQLFMSNFSTGAHLLLLTPSLVTENFGLGSFIRVLWAVKIHVLPKALGELQCSPRFPAGQVGSSDSLPPKKGCDHIGHKPYRPQPYQPQNIYTVSLFSVTVLIRLCFV